MSVGSLHNSQQRYVAVATFTESIGAKMIETIVENWGWTGLRPTDVVAVNAFGNVIVADDQGRFWRICPEELSCEVIADGSEGYQNLLRDEEFVDDWEMRDLTDLAEQLHGSNSAGRCYCLKLPGVRGGEYAAENIGTNSVAELLAFSGNLANQIKDLPDGAEIQIDITD